MSSTWCFGVGRSCRTGLRLALLASVLAAVAIAPSVIRPVPAVAEAPGLATVVSDTPLLAEPDPDAAMLTTVAAGSEVVLSGAAALGYLEVTADGRTGWVPAQDLTVGGQAGIPVADADEPTPILAAPVPDAEVLATIPAGGVVILTGANVGGYVAGSYEGTGGWISEVALGMPHDADLNAS